MAVEQGSAKPSSKIANAAAHSRFLNVQKGRRPKASLFRSRDKYWIWRNLIRQ